MALSIFVVSLRSSIARHGVRRVTAAHEALHVLFRQDAELFARTVREVFGVDVPEPTRITVLNADLTETQPLERRADSVILAVVENLADRYILVVESQTEPDDEKQWSWPYYIAYLRAKYRCPVVLLVVTTKRATAVWARNEITSGLPGLTCMSVMPVVLGPDNVPAMTDPERASSHGAGRGAAVARSQ